MKALLVTACLIIAVLQSTASFSAPMAPRKPITIEGTIEDVSWVQMETAEGIPGMSGSARHDRIFPAHYKVKLNNIIVPERTNSFDHKYKNGGTATLELNHEQDDGYLKPSMRIKVIDYTIWGDEGGRWTYFKSLEILPDN